MLRNSQNTKKIAQVRHLDTWFGQLISYFGRFGEPCFINHIFLGKVDMRLELDDVSVYMAKNSDKTISMSEKMTQTDWQMFDRAFGAGDPGCSTSALASGASAAVYKTTPNGTSPCNHPSLSCQVSHRHYCVACSQTIS